MNSCIFDAFPIVTIWRPVVLSAGTLPSVPSYMLLPDCTLFVSICCLCWTVFPVKCYHFAWTMFSKSIFKGTFFVKYFPSLSVTSPLVNNHKMLFAFISRWNYTIWSHSFVVLWNPVCSPFHHQTSYLKAEIVFQTSKCSLKVPRTDCILGRTLETQTVHKLACFIPRHSQ